MDSIQNALGTYMCTLYVLERMYGFNTKCIRNIYVNIECTSVGHTITMIIKQIGFRDIRVQIEQETLF